MGGEIKSAVWTLDSAQAVIDRHLGLDGPLLPILHALQTEFGFVPAAVTPLIASALNLSRAEVHGVISFYHDFRTEPAGRRVLKLCLGEACQARGGRAIRSQVEQDLGISIGETTTDRSVTLEAVYCLGLCASGPAALLDGAPIGRLDVDRAAALAATLA